MSTGVRSNQAGVSATPRVQEHLDGGARPAYRPRAAGGISDRRGAATPLAARNAAGALKSRTRRRAAVPRPPPVPPHAHVLMAVGRLPFCSLSASRSSGSGSSSVTRIPRVPSIPGVSSLPSRSGPAGRSGVTRIPRVPSIPGVSSLPGRSRAPGRSSLSGWCRRTSRTRRTWWPLVATDKSEGKSKYHRAQPHNEGILHL
jgi:hypothetical protein